MVDSSISLTMGLKFIFIYTQIKKAVFEIAQTFEAIPNVLYEELIPLLKNVAEFAVYSVQQGSWGSFRRAFHFL